ERSKKEKDDRQRRQSMSIEEREKHLARRRGNYQLRRQRAENARFDPCFYHTSILDSDDMLTTNQNQLTSASDIIIQICNDAPHVVSGGRKNLLETLLIGLEVPAHRLAEFPGKLRLNHLKRLARSSNGPMGVNHKIGVDVFIKGNAASNCISPKGVRLNHVKQFARGLKSAVKENVPESLQSKSE
ncbi:hypothetical protein CFOL_v3_17898, partial [Cephalotus follicularis]